MLHLFISILISHKYAFLLLLIHYGDSLEIMNLHLTILNNTWHGQHILAVAEV